MAKYTPFKMKGSPFQRNYGIPSPAKETNTQYSKEAQNLLKAVPNKEAYDKLTAMEQKDFDIAAKKYGLPQKLVRKS